MRVSDWSSDVCSSDLPVLLREADVAGAGADAAREAPEAHQAAPDRHEETDGEDRHREIDRRGDAHLDGLPVWLVDRGAEELGGRMGGDDGPAAGPRVDQGARNSVE